MDTHKDMFMLKLNKMFHDDVDNIIMLNAKDTCERKHFILVLLFNSYTMICDVYNTSLPSKDYYD